MLSLDVEKERSLIANVPPNMYESNVCLPELAEYIPPPAHHYNNNNTGKYYIMLIILSIGFLYVDIVYNEKWTILLHSW